MGSFYILMDVADLYLFLNKLKLTIDIQHIVSYITLNIKE